MYTVYGVCWVRFHFATFLFVDVVHHEKCHDLQHFVFFVEVGQTLKKGVE